MCRALRVLCVAPDRDRLAALKGATVSADWELTAGATSEAQALEQLDAEHPHVVVLAGAFDAFAREARRRYPFLRIVSDRPLPESTAVVGELEDVRAAVRRLPRPPGPVV